MVTKLQPPAYRDELVHRDRLMRLLREGNTRRLVSIHAPAGYGKTTLAVQWMRALEADGVRAAWLSLDESDNDVASFVRHLVEAVRRVDPSVPVELVEALDALAADPIRDVLVELVNHTAARGQRLVVILDDWHIITRRETAAALDFLIENAPELLHLVITSRTRSPEIGRLRVDDQVTEIDAALLRFDERESADFLLDVKALSLDTSEVRQLWIKTEGWVAALQLATLSLRDSHNPTELIEGFSGRHRAVGDYLVENVLNALPSQVLDFMLAVSILDRVNGELAYALSGQKDGQGLLEALEQRDMFLRPLDDDREWFRFHQLFVAHLRRRLEQRVPDRVRSLHRTAGAWFADHGLLGEAVTHALAADDSAWAVDLVESQAMDFVENSQMAALLALAERLPPVLVMSRPVLQLAIGWSNCLLQRLEPAQAALDRIRAAVLDDRDGSWEYLRGEVDILQSCVDAFRDRIDRAGALTAPFIDDPGKHRAFLNAVAANIQVFIDIQHFRFDDARSRLRTSLPQYAATQGPFAEVYGRSLAGLAAFAQLDLPAAERQYRAALHLANGTAGPRSHAARLASALVGRLSFERDDIDEAEPLLEACYELGVESGLADFMIPAFTTLSRVKMLRGDADAAIEVLRDGAAAGTQLRLGRLRAAVEHARVQLYLTLGQVTQANDVVAAADTTLPRGRDGISTSIRHHLLMMRGRVAAAMGDYDDAAQLIGQVYDEARVAPHAFDAMMSTLALGTVEFAAGRRESARQLVVPALIAASRAGVKRSILDAGPTIRTLLGELRDAQRRRAWPADLPEVPGDYLTALLSMAYADESRTALPAAERPRDRRSFPEEPLNAREVMILRHLERGLSNAEIAAGLGLTVNTVKWHLKNIYVKLSTARRGAAVDEARRRGLL